MLYVEKMQFFGGFREFLSNKKIRDACFGVSYFIVKQLDLDKWNIFV